jgi:hypothetical protein
MGIADFVHGDELPRTGEESFGNREDPKLSPNSLECPTESER